MKRRGPSFNRGNDLPMTLRAGIKNFHHHHKEASNSGTLVIMRSERDFRLRRRQRGRLDIIRLQTRLIPDLAHLAQEIQLVNSSRKKTACPPSNPPARLMSDYRSPLRSSDISTTLQSTKRPTKRSYGLRQIFTTLAEAIPRTISFGAVSSRMDPRCAAFTDNEACAASYTISSLR